MAMYLSKFLILGTEIFAHLTFILLFDKSCNYSKTCLKKTTGNAEKIE